MWWGVGSWKVSGARGAYAQRTRKHTKTHTRTYVRMHINKYASISAAGAHSRADGAGAIVSKNGARFGCLLLDALTTLHAAPLAEVRAGVARVLPIFYTQPQPHTRRIHVSPFQRFVSGARARLFDATCVMFTAARSACYLSHIRTNGINLLAVFPSIYVCVCWDDDGFFICPFIIWILSRKILLSQIHHASLSPFCCGERGAHRRIGGVVRVSSTPENGEKCPEPVKPPPPPPSPSRKGMYCVVPAATVHFWEPIDWVFLGNGLFILAPAP